MTIADITFRRLRVSLLSGMRSAYIGEAMEGAYTQCQNDKGMLHDLRLQLISHTLY